MTSLPCGSDRRWYNTLATDGIPDDPLTVRYAAEALPKLWEQYQAVETILRDFLCTQKAGSDDDPSVLVEVPASVARGFIAEVDDNDEPSIESLGVAVRVASALADRIPKAVSA